MSFLLIGMFRVTAALALISAALLGPGYVWNRVEKFISPQKDHFVLCPLQAYIVNGIKFWVSVFWICFILAVCWMAGGGYKVV